MSPDLATPNLEVQLEGGKKYVRQALERAHSETRYVASLAERLFVEHWISQDGDMPVARAREHFDKCLRISEEIRKQIELYQFDLREKYDKDLRGKAMRSGLILPDASMVADHVPPGSIPGLD